jgi:hypothetical protein
MLLAFALGALGALGRDAAKVAVGLAVVPLLGLAFLASVLGGLVGPPSASTPAVVSTSAPGVSVPGPTLAAPALGDTRWGFGNNTYCETYVEQQVGWGNQGATAFQAFLRLAGLGLVHAGPPPHAGVVVYFGPSSDNEWDGHVGISDGDGTFTSITSWGLQRMPLAGWRAPYLGWVEPAAVHSDRFGNPVFPHG